MPEPKVKKLFGQLLVRGGIVKVEHVNEALTKQNTTMGHRKIGEILVRLGYISRSHVQDILVKQLDLKLLGHQDLEGIPKKVIDLVEGNIATLYRVVPIRKRRDGKIVVATADPTNINSLDNLGRLLDKGLVLVMASSEDIAWALRQYYGLSDADFTMLGTVGPMSLVSPGPQLSPFNQPSPTEESDQDAPDSAEKTLEEQLAELKQVVAKLGERVAWLESQHAPIGD